MLKKGDVVLIISVVLAAAIMFMLRSNFFDSSDTEKIVVIKQDGKIIRKVDLNKLYEPQLITAAKNKVTIKAEKGKICFSDSHCKDKICVKTGWLSHKGERAVCLPLRTEVMIIDEKEPDSISY